MRNTDFIINSIIESYIERRGTHQILSSVGYDYDKIGLVVYNPKQEMVQKSQSMQM